MNWIERALFRRPGALNVLHRLHLVNPTSQTTESELNALARYATTSRLALEIGSYQGVSAARIAAAMLPNAVLFCVDPWPASDGRTNSCYSIFERHVRRAGVHRKIRPLRFSSAEIIDLVPSDLDFAFVDGDHSWSGIQTDWDLVRSKIKHRGIVCLHDSFVPPHEPWRQPDSVRFFEEVIARDTEFSVLERVHSLAVIQKNAYQQI